MSKGTFSSKRPKARMADFALKRRYNSDMVASSLKPGITIDASIAFKAYLLFG